MGEKNLDVRMTFHDQFSSGFKQSLSTMSSGSKAAQRAWKGVKKGGDAIAKVGSTLTKSVTAPIVGLGVASVKNFGDVDKQMRLVEQTMGKAKWQTADLTGAMKDAASASVFSMQDAADASLNFARQGFNAKQSADMLTPALNLAAGTGTGLSNVTAGLGNTLKAFGANANEATHYADMFAQAQAQANTDTQGLFDAMAVAGPMAKSVGWSFSDLGAITGIFGDHSISASEGAHALNTGLMRIASPAEKGSIAMKQLGLNVFDAKGQLDSMPVLMTKLHNKFKDLNDQQKLVAADAIFGKNQGSKWIALIDTAPSKFSKLKNSIDGPKTSAKGMADALMSGVGGSIEKLKSTFDVFKYNIGEIAGGAIKGFIDKITSLLDKFNKMDPAQQKMIVKFAGIAAAVGPVLTGFGKGISLIGSAGGKISKFKGIIAGVMETTSKAGKGGGILSKLLGGTKGGQALSGIGSKVGGVFTRLAGGNGVMGGVPAKLTGMMSKIPGVGKVFGALSTKLAAPTKGFKLLRVAIAGITSPLGIVIAVVGLAAAAFIAIKTHMGAFKKGLSASKPAINNIKKSFKGLQKEMKPIMPVLKKLGQIFAEVFSGVIISVITGAVAFVTNAIDTMIKVITNIVKIIKNVVKLVKAIFTGDWKGAFEAGKNIVQGFVDTVKSIFGGIVNTIKGVGKAIGNVFSKIKIPHFSGGGVIPHKAVGDSNWGGGLVQVHERGGEIMDLPGGTRIYPHDESLKMAAKRGSKSITIAKIADSIVVREQADIDRITDALVRKMELAEANALG